MITGAHLRMIRAALRLSVRQVAAMANLSKSTVFELERDVRRVHGGTVEKILEAFAPYVEFVEPVEGVRGPGIIMKWGIQPIGDDLGEPGEAAPNKTGTNLKAAPWDDFSTDDERPPSPEVSRLAADLTDEDRAELAETLGTPPISTASRRLIERAMQGQRWAE
jgi:transcriptional regulator with XRE-family HTH domain